MPEALDIGLATDACDLDGSAVSFRCAAADTSAETFNFPTPYGVGLIVEGTPPT
ncbi:hypothetical protein [Variovorax sp. SRS16]|uniref:hypothetical protein n=1 Tax=Variovorax sp. SRS16 TaxID=282217 RepID=UPI0013A56E81|nr:hypothetical protein [Variovorax sp. SRS16]